MNLHSRSWTDLIFENRNKSYGAYKLRMGSGMRHLWSLLISIALLSIGYLLWYWYDNYSYQKSQKEEEAFVAEQYELLTAIMEEEPMRELAQTKIPNPYANEATEKSNSKRSQPQSQDLLDLMVQPETVIDMYYEELTKETEEEEKETEPKDEVAEDQLYTTVDIMPGFPGGENGLILHLAKNIRYPNSAYLKKLQSTVTCSFIIDKDGMIRQIQVIKPVDPDLDREAIRVLRTMPRWKPAMKNGKPIAVKYILPVVFRLK